MANSNPQPRQDDRLQYWDSIAPSYDSLYDNPWSRYEDDNTARLLGRAFKRAPGGNVLDIGCGTGLGYALLSRTTNAFTYSGIDISKQMLSELMKRYQNAETHVGDALDILPRLDAASYDLITAINTTASFIADQRKLSVEINRLLRPGGIYLLSFLNEGSLRRRLGLKFGSTEAYKTRGDAVSSHGVVAQLMNSTKWKELIVSTNLTLEEVRYQSVLGGVCEVTVALPLEQLLCRSRPRCGHELIVSGRKGS